MFTRVFSSIIVLFLLLAVQRIAFAQEPQPIRHAVLIAGGFTGIIDEEGREVWQTRDGAKDATRMANGHILITYPNEVVEFNPAKEIVWRFAKAETDAELVSAWRLENGETMIVVLGDMPRLIEVDSQSKTSRTIPIDPEQTENTHMQTRMARPLPNGNYLAPHLFGYSVREYTPDGKVVADFQTDTAHFGGPDAKNWPFTAIRTEKGTTVVGCTYGNRVVEFDAEGKIVWELTNDNVNGIIKDACGVQRLPNGNTVVTCYGQREPEAVKLFEVTPDKKVVWTYTGHHAHHFQILTTNGEPLSGLPMK